MKGCISSNTYFLMNNLDDSCQNCLSECSTFIAKCCPVNGVACRMNRQIAHGFDCFLCLDNKEARNKNVFIERFQLFLSSINLLQQIFNEVREKAEQIERDKYYKIVHNLKHLNAEALGEQYNFIPQGRMAENYRDLFSWVYAEIKKDLKGATLLLLKQAKINAHIKTEFDTHELLSMRNPILDVRSHSVREVILNVYHPYERDFKAKNVNIIFGANMGKAWFDYRTMRLAFAHILSNAAKYVKAQTTIEVLYEDSATCTDIIFSMVSISIPETEVDSIFVDGFSGSIPQAHSLNGSGLGMGLIKKAVELNKGEFRVYPGETNMKGKNGISYSNNKFIISLKK